MKRYLRQRHKKLIFLISSVFVLSVIFCCIYNVYFTNNSRAATEVVGSKQSDENKEVKEISEEQLVEKLVFALKNLAPEKIYECVEYKTDYDVSSEYENLMLKAYSILEYEYYEVDGRSYIKGKHSNISAGINSALESKEDTLNYLIKYYKDNPIVIREFDFEVTIDGEKLKLTQELLELITCGFY